MDFLSKYGSVVDIDIQPDTNYRLYKGIAVFRTLKSAEKLVSREHVVLTSTLTIRWAKIKKDSKPEELKYFLGGTGNLKAEKSLFRYFSQFGTIKTAKIMRDRFKGSNRGFGFVTFSSCSETVCSLRSESTFHWIEGNWVESRQAVTREEMKLSRFLTRFAKDENKIRVKRTSTKSSDEYFDEEFNNSEISQ